MATVKSNQDLKNRVYHTLKERLINCDYPPASVLNEAQLASELGLSRTPIREAISRLELEGLVKIMPKKGIYVTDISLNDVIQIFQTRLEIEPIALRLAANYLPMDELLAFRDKFAADAPDIKNGFRLDTAMHLFIIEHCRNRYIIELMRRVFDDNSRVIISSKQNQIQIHDARLEHLNILNLLINRDAKNAETAMRIHIESCRQAAMNFFLSYQLYDCASDGFYKRELNKLEPQ